MNRRHLSFASRAAALAVVAGAVGAVPRSARAACDAGEACPAPLGPQSYVYIVGGVADVMGVIGVVIGGVAARSPDNSLARALYVVGGVTVAAGALTLGLQAAVGCGDTTACSAGYGMGGAGTAAGVVTLGMGVYTSVMSRGRQVSEVRYLPVPLVIRTAHGAAPGLGLVGIGF